MNLSRIMFWNFAFYTVAPAMWGLALALTICAAWTDWRRRRIPNALTIPAAVVGLTLSWIVGRWPGLERSFEGMALALGLLLPFVLLRGMGAGDWKLMGAVGAIMGMYPMLFVFLVSAITSAVIAILQMFVSRCIKRTVRNVGKIVAGVAKLKPDSTITLDNPTLLKVPFGVTTGAATVLSFLLIHWHQ